MKNEKEKISQLRNRLKEFKNSCPSYSYYEFSEKWSFAGVMIDKEEAERILLKLMQDENPIVRWKTLELIRETKIHSNVIIKNVRELMRTDSSTFVNSEAAFILCLLGKNCEEGMKIIRKGLKEYKNWLACYHSAFTLYSLVNRGIKITKAVEDLKKLKGENYPQFIREIAVQALKKIKEQDTIAQI